MTSPLRRCAGAGAVAAALLAGLAGCGVPTGGDPDVIAATRVPFGLASPTPSAPASATTTPVPTAPEVYFLRQDGSLVGRGRDLPGPATAAQLPALLTALAAGPTETERAAGLSSALAPGTQLTVAGLQQGVVTIALGGEVDPPSGDATRRAVAQLVLTATSLPGVQAVRLSRDGQPVDAPLPSGALTSEPLTTADYDVLTTPSPTPAPPSGGTGDRPGSTGPGRPAGSS